jgi:hypothetical protein
LDIKAMAAHVNLTDAPIQAIGDTPHMRGRNVKKARRSYKRKERARKAGS